MDDAKNEVAPTSQLQSHDDSCWSLQAVTASHEALQQNVNHAIAISNKMSLEQQEVVLASQNLQKARPVFLVHSLPEASSKDAEADSSQEPRDMTSLPSIKTNTESDAANCVALAVTESEELTSNKPALEREAAHEHDVSLQRKAAFDRELCSLPPNDAPPDERYCQPSPELNSCGVPSPEAYDILDEMFPDDALKASMPPEPYVCTYVREGIFPFLLLPTELRHMIYKYSFGGRNARIRWRGYTSNPVLYHPASWLQPRVEFQFLALCHFTRAECLPIFYDSSHLEFYDLDSLIELLEPSSGPSEVISKLTRNISVRYEGEEIKKAFRLIRHCQHLETVTLEMTNLSMKTLWKKLPRFTRETLESNPGEDISKMKFNEAGMKELFSLRSDTGKWRVHVKCVPSADFWLSLTEQHAIKRLMAFHFPPES